MLYIYIIFFPVRIELYSFSCSQKNPCLIFESSYGIQNQCMTDEKVIFRSTHPKKKQYENSESPQKCRELFLNRNLGQIVEKKVGVYFPSESCFKYFAANFSS